MDTRFCNLVLVRRVGSSGRLARKFILKAAYMLKRSVMRNIISYNNPSIDVSAFTVFHNQVHSVSDYHVLENKLEHLGKHSEVKDFSPSHSQFLLED